MMKIVGVARAVFPKTSLRAFSGFGSNASTRIGITVRKSLAAVLAASALTLGTSLLAVGTASASANTATCRKPDVSADSLDVRTCADWYIGSHITGTVHTSGTNRTVIDLCIEIVDVNQNMVPGSRNCQLVAGADGTVTTPPVSPPAGTYFAVSSFTSPTYYYGGETPAFHYS